MNHKGAAPPIKSAGSGGFSFVAIILRQPLDELSLQCRIFHQAVRELLRDPVIMSDATIPHLAHKICQRLGELGLESILIGLAFYQLELLFN